MAQLDDEVKEHLDSLFDDFLSGLIKKFRWPAIGVAVVFAAFMSAFATYTYVKARSEVSAAQVQFYQNMIKTQQDIEQLKVKFIEKFNLLMTDLDMVAVKQLEDLNAEIDQARERILKERQPPKGDRFDDARRMTLSEVYRKLKAETRRLNDRRFEEYVQLVLKRVRATNEKALIEKFEKAIDLVAQERRTGERMSAPPAADRPDAPPAKIVPPKRELKKYKIDPDLYRQQQMQAPPPQGG